MKKIIKILVATFLFAYLNINCQTGVDVVAYKDYLYSYNAGILYKLAINSLSPNHEVFDNRININVGRKIGGITLNNNYLYISYKGENNGTISKFDLDENEPTENIVITNLDIDPKSLAFYNDELYIGSFNKISKIDLNATNPTLIEITPFFMGSTTNNYVEEYDLVFLNDVLYILSIDKISYLDINKNNPVLTEIITDIRRSTDLIAYQNYLLFSNDTEHKIYKIDLDKDPIEKNDLEVELNATRTMNSPLGMVVYVDNLYVLASATRDYSKFYKAVNGTLSNNTYQESKNQIYPNPASNHISLPQLEINKDYKIYNSIGKIVKSGKITHSKKIDIQDLKVGIYFLHIEKLKIKFIKN